MRYSIKIGSSWFTSHEGGPLTERAQFRGVFEDRLEADFIAADFGGVVMVEPSDWRKIPTEIAK